MLPFWKGEDSRLPVYRNVCFAFYFLDVVEMDLWRTANSLDNHLRKTFFPFPFEMLFYIRNNSTDACEGILLADMCIFCMWLRQDGLSLLFAQTETFDHVYFDNLLLLLPFWGVFNYIWFSICLLVREEFLLCL